MKSILAQTIEESPVSFSSDLITSNHTIIFKTKAKIPSYFVKFLFSIVVCRKSLFFIFSSAGSRVQFSDCYVKFIEMFFSNDAGDMGAALTILGRHTSEIERQSIKSY